MTIPAHAELTVEYLREILDYNEKTGIFTWKVPKGGCKAGKVAGEKATKGQSYYQIPINKKAYLAHRLAWFYVYGHFPPEQIDHINRIRSDNRICNLRLADRYMNAANKEASEKSITGIVGVYFHKPRKKYNAQISIKGKRKNLGYFVNIEDAERAYLEAKKAMYESTNDQQYTEEA